MRVEVLRVHWIGGWSARVRAGGKGYGAKRAATWGP